MISRCNKFVKSSTGPWRILQGPALTMKGNMNYKEKLYQAALDQYFKSDMYSPGMIQCAVNIVIGDDGFRGKEVLEVLKGLKKNDGYDKGRKE